MKTPSRLLLLFASLLLLGNYFLPLWSISLEAPQYPGGLRMEIFIDDIGGEDEFILQNMNILNHYIGMKKIEPDSIKELKILPYLIGFFVALGLVAFFINKRWMFWTWTILFTVFGILAMYDFYLWEYDYGHNLNPQAPIKVPGMAYQPPLLGSKMLLNFKATSLPASGGVLLILSILIHYTVLIFDHIIRRRSI